jgi:hypothetical protein
MFVGGFAEVVAPSLPSVIASRVRAGQGDRKHHSVLVRISSRCRFPLRAVPVPAAAYARKAVSQAELLRQQKREEQQKLKQDKKFSWNQKVGSQ